VFAYGGLRSGLIGLEVRGPAFGLEAKPKARTHSRTETIIILAEIKPHLPSHKLRFRFLGVSY